MQFDHVTCIQQDYCLSDGKSVRGTRKYVWILSNSLEIGKSNSYSFNNLIHIENHIRVLQDPIKFAPDIDAELLIYLVILHRHPHPKSALTVCRPESHPFGLHGQHFVASCVVLNHWSLRTGLWRVLLELKSLLTLLQISPTSAAIESENALTLLLTLLTNEANCTHPWTDAFFQDSLPAYRITDSGLALRLC